MKSLAVIIAALSLAAGAAFAGVEATHVEGKVKTEGAVTGAQGAKVNADANVAGSGVRTSTTTTSGANIISNIANTQSAAKAIGGSCEPGAFDSLSVADRATIASAVKTGIGGDRCAKQFDKETIQTVAVLDGAELAALKATGASSVTASNISDSQRASIVVAGAKALAAKIGVSVSESVARLQGTCAKACDVLSSALCAAPVLSAAQTQAAAL